ncbi:DEAD/DEAH box helicase [Waddlia chondrophila]|uniref:ATP-dependent RNA helicase DBP2 n=2 Tax=Waddlia chondrophila TaxID=71667 RepID=D6YUR4_WADCW|nr:DEAD/DEAH box helicase [Waddlia chondrophila]ADI37875.1 ATP-dependent RNA helicase DBP2 [Waddlia chondrophila WSU 86-1044]
MTFDALNLHSDLLKALNAAGYKSPTEIQCKAIPKAVKGFDLRASAQTGSGKTAAFLLPALHHCVANPRKPTVGPRVLILSPTRELAMQIATQADKYSKFLNRVKSVCISGGVPYHVQQRKLRRPYEILIATPGRLIDYINQKAINLSAIEILVLDEADRMLDMGFIEPVEKIAAATPSSRQTLLFSATMQGSVLNLSNRLLNEPMDIVIHSEKTKHENITQKLHYVDGLQHKNQLLEHILNDDVVKHAIVFTSTKRHASQLVFELHDKGLLAGALHGDMSQRQRSRTIAQLRTGKIKVLVATDVAARGIDVQNITHVINFDLPRNVEDYVHRIGRTGRAGAAGTALSFASGKDTSLVKKIEEYTGQPIDVAVVAGLEPKPIKTEHKNKPAKRPANKWKGKHRHKKPSAGRAFKGSQQQERPTQTSPSWKGKRGRTTSHR